MEAQCDPGAVHRVPLVHVAHDVQHQTFEGSTLVDLFVRLAHRVDPVRELGLGCGVIGVRLLSWH